MLPLISLIIAAYVLARLVIPLPLNMEGDSAFWYCSADSL
jgi:hypothetical protein